MPARLAHALGSPYVHSFTVSVAIQAMNAATGVLLARELGPHARGELAIVVLWPGILAALGSLGMQESITYHAARSHAPPRVLAGTALVAALVQAAAVTAAAAGAAVLVLADEGEGVLASAFLYLAYIPLLYVTHYAIGLLNGLHRFAAVQTVRLVVIATTAAGVAGVAVLDDLTVRAAVVIYLVANVLSSALALTLVVRAGVRSLAVSRALARDLLRFGSRSHVANVSSVLNERLDQLVISVFLAPASLGLYVVAVTLTSLTAVVGASVSLVALPTLAALPPAEARAVARARVAQTLVVSAAVTLPLLLFTPSLVELFFGSAFAGATDAARVLLVASVALSTNRVLSAVLQAAGRPLDAGIGEALALVVTIAALAALLPYLGLVGASVASLLAYLTALAWNARRAAAALGVDARAGLAGEVAR